MTESSKGIAFDLNLATLMQPEELRSYIEQTQSNNSPMLALFDIISDAIQEETDCQIADLNSEITDLKEKLEDKESERDTEVSAANDKGGDCLQAVKEFVQVINGATTLSEVRNALQPLSTALDLVAWNDDGWFSESYQQLDKVLAEGIDRANDIYDTEE